MTFEVDLQRWKNPEREVNTMAKKDEGTRDIKKGKERER
jgi:hypothetical protein